MSKLLCALLILGATVTSGSASADGVYRWTDKNGKIYYSDLPPPPDAQKVEQRAARGNQIEVDKLPYATRKAAEAFPVTLYTADKCPACPDAQKFLKDRGVPYTETRLSSAEDIAVASKMLGEKDVPVPSLLVGGKPFKGFSDSEWSSALSTAGYPDKAAKK